MPTRHTSAKPPRAFTAETVRSLAVALPRAEEGPCYGTPGFRVAGRLFARLREDGDTLVLRADLDTRDALIEARPDLFFTTDHYRGHPWVLVHFRLLPVDELRGLLAAAWRQVAPKRLVNSLQAPP